MLGAILGDIVGSPYEKKGHRLKTKSFPWFVEESHFTDDTVTTVAVADALMVSETAKTGLILPLRQKLRYWCRLYPDAGFGPYFKRWFLADHMEPYGSFGNGAAMRVSAAAWVGRSLEEAQYLAELSASVTHDHEEAIKGAVAVASAIYLARTGQDRIAIRTYIQQYFYPLEQSIDEIRPSYEFTSSTKDSVPQAIEAFLESTDFEDALRNAVSLGGDSDTQAAISGSIAEAYYGGVPAVLWNNAKEILTPELLQVVRAFQDKYLKI